MVTEFEFRLHPVGTQALVVDVYYEVDDAGVALRGWRDMFADTPRQATPVARVGRREEFGGRPVASIGYVWVGDPDEGRRLLPSYSRIGRPLASRVRELSYLDLQTGDDAAEGHALRRYCKGHYLRELPDAAIDVFLAWGDDPFRPNALLTLNGGAIAEVPDEDSAYSHRDAQVEFTTAAGWTAPDEDEARITAARRYAADLAPYTSGAYVNTIADEDDSVLRRAYSAAKLARLRDLKRSYDPTNVFHRTTNIRP